MVKAGVSAGVRVHAHASPSSTLDFFFPISRFNGHCEASQHDAVFLFLSSLPPPPPRSQQT